MLRFIKISASIFTSSAEAMKCPAILSFVVALVAHKDQWRLTSRKFFIDWTAAQTSHFGSSNFCLEIVQQFISQSTPFSIWEIRLRRRQQICYDVIMENEGKLQKQHVAPVYQIALDAMTNGV